MITLLAFLLVIKIVDAQEVLLSIPVGEQLLHAESNLSLFDQQGKLQVCTVDKNGKYFVYSGGKKSGPYSSAQKATANIDYGSGSDDSSPEGPGNEAYNEQLVKMDGNGLIKINIGGKSYGPFVQIRDLFRSSDGKRFFALVGSDVDENDDGLTDFKIISNVHPDVVLEGEPYDLRTDQQVSMAVVVSKCEKRSDDQQEAMTDYNAKMEEIMARMQEGGEMSLEQLAQMGKELEGLEQESGYASVEYIVYTADGKHFGPFTSDNWNMQNPGFGSNSKGRWYMLADGKLYINGKASINFDNTEVSGFWWASNGNNFALATYDELVFSTGERYPYPLQFKVTGENGQTILKWLMLEQERKFVAYQKKL
ncbi:MAG: hypothetical protein JXR22_08650 [Prolixibacteraceae bacterium]|nr:hypothetical protein [Prolixibacteraceae bacterium]